MPLSKLPVEFLVQNQPAFTPTPTLLKIKNDVNAELGVRNLCTDESASFISQQDSPSAYIKMLSQAIAEIGEHSNGNVKQNIAVIINNRNIFNLFIRHPRAFVEITKAADSQAYLAFMYMSNLDQASLFEQDSQAFIDIARLMRRGAGSAFLSLGRSDMKEWFMAYHNRPDSHHDGLMLRLLIQNGVAIELGLPIDDLHEKPQERQKFLDSLSTLQVLGLLLSEPDYFYTSSNHMLIDRLKADLERRGSSVSDWLERDGLLKEYRGPGRNFMFRLLNYDRAYGKPNSLLSKKDFEKLDYVILGILTSPRSDATDYYLLANNLRTLKRIGMGPKLLSAMAARLEIGVDAKTKKAFEFLGQCLRNEWDSPKAEFHPELYRAKDGKLQIVQIFDRNDTEKDHWGLSQAWAAQYGKPSSGPDGELIYENNGVRIVLFMGADSEGQENQAFLRKKLFTDPNMVLTFRGHSFSLEKNIPYGIFSNGGAHILFIPGSCGSSGSVPEYLLENPETDLRMVSNTSTGRGQVTNELLSIFIKTRTKNKFKNILKSNSKRIQAAGGDAGTIKIYGEGEALLDYAYRSK